LWVVAVVMAAFAIARIKSEPAIKKGSITTRWREGGDVVEHCTSCHEGPHPDAQAALLDIHPVAKFGCISCHGGNASGADLSAHDGLLVTKNVMLVEAGCGRCHASEKKLATKDGVDRAPHLSKGRAIFESKCAVCHDPDASHDRAVPLRWLSATADPTALMGALKDPPPTMPRFFGDGDGDARKNVVAWITSLDAPASLQGAANVPGASADDGRWMAKELGCLACHANNFGDISRENREDFIAVYIQNPKRIFAGAKMPSLRLTKREAASLAKFVASSAPPPTMDADASDAATPAFRNARAKCSAANDVELTHAECGAKIVAKLGCASCHSDEKFPIANAPDLTAFGANPATDDRLIETATAWKSPKHPAIPMDAEESNDVLVALASMMNAHVTADFDPSRAPYFDRVRGDELLEGRGCWNCHARATKERRTIGSIEAPNAQVPSLMGEGAHVQPQWLLAFLRDPEANGVRAPLHPEWVWGELVPPEKMAVRMPTYNLTNDEQTAIVRALATEDGGDFPFADPTTPNLSTSDISSALVHVNGEADNGGACFTCHYLGALPIDRAKTNLNLLAPDLGNVWRRLRPWFVADLLAKPQDFVDGMPALWPDATGAPLPWTIPSDATPKKNAVDQIAMVRDFLFLLRDETRLPRAGDELKTPILGLAVSSTQLPTAPASQ
jgi:mono/diheme cytochrome c family protein